MVRVSDIGTAITKSIKYLGTSSAYIIKDFLVYTCHIIYQSFARMDPNRRLKQWVSCIKKAQIQTLHATSSRRVNSIQIALIQPQDPLHLLSLTFGGKEESILPCVDGEHTQSGSTSSGLLQQLGDLRSVIDA